MYMVTYDVIQLKLGNKVHTMMYYVKRCNMMLYGAVQCHTFRYNVVFVCFTVFMYMMYTMFNDDCMVTYYVMVNIL